VSPQPPLSPPAPPVFPGVDVAAASENELRSLIEGAAANISIYLPPTHFELGSQISCSSNLKVTVASSGEGATLDGQGETRLFSLSGGCSLTLRGLTLVNGRAAQYGGVVYAYGAGDVEIIESTVTGCSAGDVRRVELAARPALPHGSGARDAQRATAAHPALSSQPQSGGVVIAYKSGAVSIIGSTVKGCSSGYVRRVELAAPLQPHGSGARGRKGHACLTPLSPRNRSTAASSTRWPASPSPSRVST